MKTVLLLSTLVLIAAAAVSSLQLFVQSNYYMSALLTAASFLSACFWISKVNEEAEQARENTFSSVR